MSLPFDAAAIAGGCRRPMPSTRSRRRCAAAWTSTRTRRAERAAGGGELLLMPSAAGGGLGVKLVTVGGEPRIKGVFVLFDGETLAPVAVLDGIGLTDVRTSAVSALAVRHLAPDARRLVVFGTGPQARAHVPRCGRAPIEHVGVIGRDDDARELGAEPAAAPTRPRLLLHDGA